MKKNISVICGGISEEREVSLRSGLNVFNNLNRNKYNAALIEITAGGQWVIKNIFGKIVNHAVNDTIDVFPMNNPIQTTKLKTFDCCVLMLHGFFGEDGKIQGLLDLLNVPYTGSDSLSSAIAMNKYLTQKILKVENIISPKSVMMLSNSRHEFAIKEILKLKFPLIAKPNSSGSSFGLTKLNSKKELKLYFKTRDFNSDWLFQEMIIGKEYTCPIISQPNSKARALPPIEILSENELFDYASKYDSAVTKEICPANMTKLNQKKLTSLAVKAHEKLGCNGLTRSDFIFSGGKFYFLEINTLPGMTPASLCPKSAVVDGIGVSGLLDYLIEGAIK